MELWFKTKGIMHTKVGPKSSPLNAVERTHQTLESKVKMMMHDSGLLKSMWIHALETAVYVKNRVFCKGDGEFALAHHYVYDILCATRNEAFKKRLFSELNEAYGIKDQCFVSVGVQQNENSIKFIRLGTVRRSH
ncbi:Copia type Polyprotein [Phytophthora megakarya]|uniref:Copia type Polyprotein n=1 Tax=Phytophthora megakarya TaxID=4795 RepID=A0A225UFS4_9STRA|nr:Copia type Polyprotein [Phytophthora megakarya]